MGYDYLAMDYLGVLRAKLDEFAALLDGDVDLDAPVAHCGDWTYHALVDHVGRGNMWVATAVAEDRGDYFGDPAPADLAGLRPWFAATAAAILGAVSADPETPAWTFTSSAPRNVGFWRRRRAHETLMHLWDAQNSQGMPQPFPVELAADGVAEVFELFAPRLVDRGFAPAPTAAVRLTATDVPPGTGIAASWTHGPGEPVAELSGPVSDLLLTLWGRKPNSDKEFTWDGDRAAGEQVLAGPLVP